MGELEQLIQQKAYSLGYEKCGMIPVEAMGGYDEKFNERIRKVPESEKFYERQKRLTKLREQYPWAKSIIVAVMPYGKYKVPEHLRGKIAKHYLFDLRVEGSAEYQGSSAFEEYLKGLGFRIASNRQFGIVGLRWAAMEAGLGIIRRNNFFYTEKSGSWVELEAWITDRELTLTEQANLPGCPKGCSRCIKSCPSGSLCEPYTMSPVKCVSFLTTFGGRDLPHEPLSKDFGGWFYGCDTCQDVCPMNRGKWVEQEDFPGVAELSPRLSPEKVLTMEEDFYKEKIQPKFFYLRPDELWKWKVNVLCYMRDNYQESYQPYLLAARDNENEKVREMACAVCKELYGI